MKQISKAKSFLLKFDLERLLTFGYVSKLPQRNLLMGYFSYIVFGLIFLSLPFSQKTHVGFINNLFNVTSAVSTTGLATVDLYNSYTFFGQFIFLFLIQMGGIGYMTLTSYTLPAEFDMQTLVRDIVKFTFVIEVIGAALLWFFFAQAGMRDPLWNGFFISISAFCTAGFSLFNNSLVHFDTNIGVNVVVDLLCIIGAVGFIFIRDIMNKIRDRKYRITFTTKIISVITFIVTAIGTVQLFFFEPAIEHYSAGNRFMVAFFHAVSAMSTGGFNTVPLGTFRMASLSTIAMLMFIGASPSGTGGGVRST